MGSALTTELDAPSPAGRLPAWIVSRRGEGSDEAAFSSGAALALLDRALIDTDGVLPLALLRDRLALRAAEACLKLDNRRSSEAEIRDAVCLTRAGDASGPAGEMFDRWRRMARIDLRHRDWPVRLSKIISDEPGHSDAERTGEYAGREGGRSSPVARAAVALVEALRASPREEASALMSGDVVLARALGWRRPVPLLAASLTRRDLASASADDADGVHACHRAIALSAGAALRLASDLERRAARLDAITPKLRTRGVGQALRLFLTRDAVSPAMLSPTFRNSPEVMSGRAARRLCDRLVELGAVRELTGRATFRLYGL